MAENTESKSRPLYYGRGAAGSNAPAYYSGGAYYGGGAYGSYGGGYYYGAPRGEEGGESVIGTISLGRILRVVRQRWISVFVCVLVGLIVSFAIYRISPTVYQSSATFMIDIGNKYGGRDALSAFSPEYGSGYSEILNTRKPSWRSPDLLVSVAEKYRENHTDTRLTQADIVGTLGGSEIEPVRNSRLISVIVRSDKRELASELATEYVKAIEAATVRENKERANTAVAQTQDDADKARRKIEEIEEKKRNIMFQNKIPSMRTQRDLMSSDLQRSASETANLETAEETAKTTVEILKNIQNNPEDFATLPEAVPRAAEINRWHEKYKAVSLELRQLRASGAFDDRHPNMVKAQIALNDALTNFNEAVSWSYKTSVGNLSALSARAENVRARRDRLQRELSMLDGEIAKAESQLSSLERQLKVESNAYNEILTRLTDARSQAEGNLEKVHLVEGGRASPAVQILPKPLMIFTVGGLLGLGVGLLFVLILDHLEDAIVGISDIEQRLSLRVLAVLPHVRRKKREQVARFVADDKYSQFAESVAGLRNLLDSPRYQMISRVILTMSTQPGEGKTVTSCSMAISNAQAGKKTLLVDFDLRRPRHATVWGVKTDNEHSLAHVLTTGDESKFASLVLPSGIENLDLAVSLAPEGVNPASLMGSQIVPDFLQWARDNYERVIVDSPPYGVVGDVMTLAPLVDSVVVMCRPDRTRFKPIQHATRHLTEAGATVIGVIVNDVEISGGSAFMPSSNSYSYSYGRYGYRSYSSYGYRPRSEAEKRDGAEKKASGDAAVAENAPSETGGAPRATDADVADDE